MKRGLAFSLSCLTAALLAGCGGGGGGSPKPRGSGVLSLTFVGEAGSAAGPVGNSHKIVIYRSDGSVIDTKTVDTATGTAEQAFQNLPSGTLRLHVGLSASAGGPEIGAVDTTFEGGGAPAPMRFEMRQAVTQAFVAPSSLTVLSGATGRLYAAAKSLDNSYVYTAPTDWTWTSETPAFATVDGSGTVTGVAEGGSAVKATHAASGKAASANVGVLSNGVRRGKWTVMVFVNAANNLYQEAVDNVNQMEKIANNPDVRFVIQWKQVRGIPTENSNPIFSGTRRYLATYDSASLTSVNNTVRSTVVQTLPGTVDMGSPDALASFVAWGKQKYPADHYALVVWDHGSGWYSARSLGPKARAISLDDQTGHYMTTPEVRQALAASLGGDKLDILAFDACVMQGAEDLIEFANYADYVAGSEENTPGPGYPYQKVFKPFVDGPDASVPTLAKSLVTEFVSHYKSNSLYSDWNLHQSVLETAKVPAFQLALENLSLALTNAPGGIGSLASDVRSACSVIAPGDGYSYYDLDQVAQNIASKATDGNVVTAANSLRNEISKLVLLNGNNSGGSFMKGLSIEFGAARYLNGAYGAHYADLRIADQTHWDDFLKNATANQG